MLQKVEPDSTLCTAPHNNVIVMRLDDCKVILQFAWKVEGQVAWCNSADDFCVLYVG